MMQSNFSKHIYWCAPGERLEGKDCTGGWIFYDEGGLASNLYATENETIEQMNLYVRQLNSVGTCVGIDGLEV